MRVLVTGGTGFVGQHIVAQLLESGHQVRCLVRNADESRLNDSVETVVGDVLKPDSLDAAATGMEAVIHLVGIIDENPSKGITFDALHRQATENMIAAARNAGVGTWIQMSANGARKDGVSAYQTSKWKAEQAVQSAGFDHWTIFRPSLVFGKPGPGVPEFASQLVSDLIKPLPVWPIFGDGMFAMQPVHVDDVAKAFVGALDHEGANGKTWCLAGPEAFPFKEILRLIAAGAGVRQKPMIPQPLWLMRPVVGLLGGILLPISSDQLEMLVEGNTCDGSAAAGALSLNLKPFDVEHLAYLAESN
jgi:NADH dehydrogenase